MADKSIANSDIAILSEEDTKHFLTPLAFKMDKSLFGLPLASPTKRGFALLIDLVLVALLSDTPGVVLALVIAITLYYLGNKKRAQERGKRKGHKRRAIMRFIAAVMLFLVLLDTLPTLFEAIGIKEAEPQMTAEDNAISLTQSLAQSLSLGAITLSTIQTLTTSDCQEVNCWTKELSVIAKQIATTCHEGDIEVTKAQLDGIFTEIINEIELPLSEQKQLISTMHKSYHATYADLVLTEKENSIENLTPKSFITAQNEQFANDENKKMVITFDDGDESTSAGNLIEAEQSNKPVYSIIEWVKGIINDLGLGFGWATFYFTAFIALGKGQTLGKKLLGIKVLQLDGSPLSLWDSFGRYGGYGAGLATGLLGFIQIYWDPNKQAIHDKISATVVIDLKKEQLTQNPY